MTNSIFSTYRTGENRVTSTILAVFEKINISTVTMILQGLTEDSTLELIKYENQIKTTNSIPDGRISASFDYLVETKIVESSIKKEQIENHCKDLDGITRLLILTPDFSKPKVIDKIDEKYTKKIIWANFDKLINGIDTILEEPLLVDREKFLLSELREFIIGEELTAEDYSRKAVIVPAGFAWSFYQQYGVYRCQPNRTFQPSAYMGFYANGKIQKTFPQILGYVDNLNLVQNDLQQAEIKMLNEAPTQTIRERLTQLKNTVQGDEWDINLKYVILTTIDAEETIQIANSIINDKKSYSGKGTAFVQKQTYVDVDDINGKQYTSEL